MITDALLAEMNDQTDDYRISRMIALGRQSAADPDVAEILGVLASGSFYERRLALLTCFGSRKGAQVLLALSDPSRLIRGLALSLIPVVCSDAQVEEALMASTPTIRAVLLTKLVRRGRRGPVDTFLTSLADRGDSELGFWLPFGTAEIVHRHLQTVLPQFGDADWKRLVRRHPDIAAAELTGQAQGSSKADPRRLHHVNAALPFLAKSRPEPALSLVRALLPYTSLDQFTLQPLANYFPNEIADLVIASEDRAMISFEALTHKLSEDRLLTLVLKQHELLGNPGLWMRRLTPQMRTACYHVAAQGWYTHEGILDPVVAALLPGELRTYEARRHLALPVLATRLLQRLVYASFLPWDEAQAELHAKIRYPDGVQRAAALTALIGAARYQAAKLSEVLKIVRARAKEQDPVRAAMLGTLAALPPSRWAAEHLGDLGQIIQDALSASDLSSATATAAERLVVALVPFHPGWAATWLGTLARIRGQLAFYDLGARLNDDDVRQIAPALTPVFASWETRERDGQLVQAARTLGRRLSVFPALVEMLERDLAITTHTYIASQILGLLSEHCRGRLPALIPALIQQDASCVTLPVVYHYLHRHRQDLLAPYLGQNVYSGRFSTGRTRFVLPLTAGFERWPPALQEIFAQTLDAVAGDNARDTPSILFAISQLAAMPAISPVRLVAFSSLDTKNGAVRDAALRALSRLDAGQGIQILVEALDDDRARVAIYALRTALLEMPLAAALALLKAVPLGKVAVAKEVVRLLGDLKTPDAYSALLDIDRQALHRDVRVALLRAFWNYLEEPASWPVLETAARSEEAVALGVVRIPVDRLSPFAQQHLVGLIAILLEHPEASVRLAVLARCVGLPLSDSDQVLMPHLLSLIGSRLPDESAAAAHAAFSTYDGNQADALGAAVYAVRSNRRALKAAADALESTLTRQRGRQMQTVRAVIAALSSDPVTVNIRAELVVSGLPWDEITLTLAQMAEAGELQAEAFMAVVQAIECPRYGRDNRGLEQLETVLAVSPDEHLRRLALASLVAQAASTEGWTADRRRRLEVYGQDPAPLVAAAAQFIFPPVMFPPVDPHSSGS